MTARTRAQLNSDADTNLPDNTTRAISPEDVRQRIKDLADSALLTEDYATSLKMATSRVLGRVTASTGAVEELTGAQVLTLAAAAPAADPTFTGAAKFPDGSASAPSITHTGDTNTGFYFGTDIVNFATAGTFAATLDASQRLIIGHTANIPFDAASTQSPRFQLHGTDYSTAAAVISRWSNNTGSPFLTFAKSRGGSIGTRAIVQSGDVLGQILFQGDDGTNFPPAASIRIDVDGTPGTNDMPGRMTLNVTADGASAVTEWFRLSQNGAISHRANAQVIIDPNSHLQLRSYTVGTLPSAATAGQWIYVSNETGGATPAFSDGTNWRRVSDRAIVS